MIESRVAVVVAVCAVCRMQISDKGNLPVVNKVLDAFFILTFQVDIDIPAGTDSMHCLRFFTVIEPERILLRIAY